MENEIQLISDGDGIAVIGDPTDVERFLESEGISAKDLGLRRLGAAFSVGAAATQAGAEIADNSGRWMKLTKESAQAVKQLGLVESKTPGVSYAMVKQSAGKAGSMKEWIQVVKGPGSMLTNPAMLAGAAGIMAQIAMQQTMAEITDYLATIDAKLDDVLRSQTNQVLARLDGVDLAIREAMSVRETVGRVSEVTWSKVQNSSGTIFDPQGYALRHLGDLAEKLEKKSKVGDLAKTAEEAEADVQKWLAVLARCFQLYDAISVLELDRVLEASPEELDLHRLGLKAARRDRLELISQSTERLSARIIAAAGMANEKMLLHPARSPDVVKSANNVALNVDDFHRLLGIESGHQSSEATRWLDAAAERWDKARETGAEGICTVRHLANEARDQARSARGELSERIAQQKLRRRPKG